MAKLESSVQRDISRELERSGWYVVKLIQTNKNGIPDLLAIRNGEMVFVEVKRPGARARPLQEFRMKELNNYGARSFVCHSVEELSGLMK